MFRKNLTLTVACAAGLMFAALPAMAIEPSSPSQTAEIAPAIEPATGVIASISEATDSFVLKMDDGSKKTFNVNDDTVYTLDGKAATKDEVLKTDAKASVTHTGEEAMSIAVTR